MVTKEQAHAAMDKIDQWEDLAAPEDFQALHHYIDQSQPVPEKDELLELAWGVIANASDWTPGNRGPARNEEKRQEWQEAAEKWRDQWLAAAPKPGADDDRG